MSDFSASAPSIASSSIYDPKRFSTPWSELAGTQVELFVEVKELSFELGDIEPFFGTLALYDVKKKIKLSENFNFDVNSNQSIELLGSHKGIRSPISLCQKAIFSLSYSSPDIYLVAIINKTLRGDDDESIDPYIKHSTVSFTSYYLFTFSR